MRFERVVPRKRRNERLYDCVIDTKGVLWIAGSRGLLAVKAGHGTRYTKRQGLRDDWLELVAQAPDGVIWISYYDGSGTSRLAFTGDVPEVKRYGSPDALHSNAISFIAFDRARRTWNRDGRRRGGFRPTLAVFSARRTGGCGTTALFARSSPTRTDRCGLRPARACRIFASLARDPLNRQPYLSHR